MSLYADYQPNGRANAARLGAECVRVARTEDAEAIARISAERDDHDPESIRGRIAGEVAGLAGDGSWCVFVAEVEGDVVGYGRVRDLTHANDGLPAKLPEGWYLTGIIVAPPFRRRGLGAALTQARLDWLQGRAHSVHFVTNVANRASIDLHAQFGFEEMARRFDYPRAEITDGQGAAFRMQLS